MKKTLMTSIIALAAIVAMPAIASAQTDGTTGATDKTETVKKDRPEARRERPGHMKANAFEGIELTDAQKEALKALRPERPERGDAKKEAADSTKRERPNPKKMRADYVNGVKGILTPDQYVIFLENIVINGANLPGDKAAMHRHDTKKGAKMKDGAKLRKGDKDRKERKVRKPAEEKK